MEDKLQFLKNCFCDVTKANSLISSLSPHIYDKVIISVSAQTAFQMWTQDSQSEQSLFACISLKGTVTNSLSNSKKENCPKK